MQSFDSSALYWIVIKRFILRTLKCLVGLKLIKFAWSFLGHFWLFLVFFWLNMGFVLHIPHTAHRPFAFKIMMVACGLYRFRLRVPCVLGLKSTLEKPQIQVYSAGNGLLAGENGWPFRRFCGGGGGLPAPLLAPRALILRTNQRLDALSRPTPPYFGHP